MVTRCPVQDAHLEAGGANVVRPAKAWRTVRPVKLAVGFVPDGSTESTARNLADHVAGSRDLMLLKRPSHPVIMSNTRSPEPPRASHLEQAARFKPLIDRMGVALQS